MLYETKTTELFSFVWNFVYSQNVVLGLLIKSVWWWESAMVLWLLRLKDKLTYVNRDCLEAVMYRISMFFFTATYPENTLTCSGSKCCFLFFLHCLYGPLGPWPLILSYMIILQTVGLLGRVISSSQGLYLNTDNINTYTYQTSMPCVGFEPTIPASERPKTVHALNCSATVTGSKFCCLT
jgi:hypothetical protein